MYGFPTLVVAALAAELSVGVAPLDALGLTDEEGEALRIVAETFIGEERPDLRLVPSAEVDRAMAEAGGGPGLALECVREAACAARAAAAAGADQLLLTSAAGLGRTYVLRLALLDGRRGVVDREVQRTIVGGASDLQRALPEQIERILPAAPRPLYERWWLWTTVGIAVAAAVAVGVSLALLLPSGSDIDSYPLP